MLSTPSLADNAVVSKQTKSFLAFRRSRRSRLKREEDECRKKTPWGRGDRRPNHETLSISPSSSQPHHEAPAPAHLLTLLLFSSELRCPRRFGDRFTADETGSSYELFRESSDRTSIGISSSNDFLHFNVCACRICIRVIFLQTFLPRRFNCSYIFLPRKRVIGSLRSELQR